MAGGSFKSRRGILSGCLEAPLQPVWDHLNEYAGGIWSKPIGEYGHDL